MGLFDFFKKRFEPAPVPLTPEEELEVQLSRSNILVKQTVMEDEVMTLEEATKIALEITSDFETQDGFSQVTGNFDDQLLSCGSLQWAWKQGTQQKLILRCEALHPGLIQSLMPLSGKKYLALAKSPVSLTDDLIGAWSGGERVIEPYCSELRKFWGCSEMVDIQVFYAGEIAKRALSDAFDWAKAVRNVGHECTVQEFCFFFDVIVNNGSMSGLTYQDVQDRIVHNGRDQVLNEITRWCSSRTRAYAAWKDCVKNGEVWKLALQTARPGEAELLVVGWLRSLKARHLYQASVMNRRGTLALGIGYTEGVKKDLNSKYPLQAIIQ